MLNADRVKSEINTTTLSSGSWYERSCPGESVNTVGWSAPTDAPAPELPSPQELAQSAVTSVTVVTPEVSLDPFYLLQDGRRATLKNVHTWVWLNSAQWTTLTPRVEVGPVWVEATIAPHTIIINPNDGVTPQKTCAGPGTPIPAGTPMDQPSPTCSVQFTQETVGGSWSVTVQVAYSVTWTGFDGTSTVGGTLPDLVSAPTTIPIAVLTAKPELIDPNSD